MCLCVLLLGCIAVITYLSLSLTNQNAENRRLSSRVSLLQNSTEFLTQERERLQQETARLENQTAKLQNLTHDLIHQRDQFNWTLQVIKSNVSKFCPNNRCQRCLSGWLPFEDSCYLFYDEPSQSKTWKTWDESQSYCRTENPFSDLVIIDSLQEQKFIHDHIKNYYDEWHGFWIGLSNQSNIWVWVDGQ
uniref:C-type lectin domain-containing protein n=1 Tax=Neogobius melanostomus TaxID=47308 RepID=A0A8C6SM94_9GOBI